MQSLIIYVLTLDMQPNRVMVWSQMNDYLSIFHFPRVKRDFFKYEYIDEKSALFYMLNGYKELVHSCKQNPWLRARL